MGQIKRRDLYYFPGYDVQGVQRYYRYLVRQSGWYARRFDVDIDVGPLRRSGIEGWLLAEVTAHWPDGDVVTRYHFCNWRRDVLEGYKPATHTRYARLFAAWGRMTINGHTRRLWRAAPRFVTTLSLPLLMCLVRIFLVATALALFAVGLLWGVLGTGLAVAGLLGLRRLGHVIYEDFFANGFIYLENRLSYRLQPDEGRLGLAVRSLCEHIAANGVEADEVMLVGHSYGAAPAIKAAHHIANGGRPVSVLTAGSISPIVSIDPNEDDLRPAVDALLHCDNVCWRDFYAPQDSLSFPRIDPVEDFCLPAAQPITADFKVRSAVYDKIVARRKIRKFRWNIMRMHFQFIMAVDFQGGFDYHRIALGPDPLKTAAR